MGRVSCLPLCVTYVGDASLFSEHLGGSARCCPICVRATPGVKGLARITNTPHPCPISIRSISTRNKHLKTYRDKTLYKITKTSLRQRCDLFANGEGCMSVCVRNRAMLTSMRHFGSNTLSTGQCDKTAPTPACTQETSPA